MTKKFSDEQIVGAIYDFMESHGYPPTQDEVAEQLGDPKYQNVGRRLRSLESRGLVSFVPNVARGVRVHEVD